MFSGVRYHLKAKILGPSKIAFSSAHSRTKLGQVPPLPPGLNTQSTTLSKSLYGLLFCRSYKMLVLLSALLFGQFIAKEVFAKEAIEKGRSLLR